MLRIVNLEEIQELLLRIPGLVELLERRDANFVMEVKRLLEKLEDVLGQNRMPVAGGVAALRATLTSAERGAIPAGITFHGRLTKRKIRDASGADILRNVNDLVTGAIAEDRARVSEAERIGRQLVTLAQAKGIITAKSESDNSTDRLKAILQGLAADPEVGQGAVQLQALVGPYDSLIVLDRAITSDVR